MPPFTLRTPSTSRSEGTVGSVDRPFRAGVEMAGTVEPRPLAWARLARPFGAQAGTNYVLLAANVRKACRRKGTACRPLVPPSPCGTPGRATCPGEVGSPASRDCIHPIERRLRSCDPRVATANSYWELTVGSSSKEKPTVTKALNVACVYTLPCRSVLDCGNVPYETL